MDFRNNLACLLMSSCRDLRAKPRHSIHSFRPQGRVDVRALGRIGYPDERRDDGHFHVALVPETA